MKISDYCSREDIARFTDKSDFHGWRLLLGNWLAIAGIFAVAGYFPSVLTISLAIVLLAGRQLGLSVLMHECGHRSLFRTNRFNDVLGQWLCALPVMNDLPSYAKGHLNHHRLAGTHEDPDLPNYQAYPISRLSFRRKVIRDLTGQTGVKVLTFLMRGGSGVLSRSSAEGTSPLPRQLLVQAALLGTLWLAGIAWTYMLWVIAYMTVFMLLIRLRQVAEHAAVPDLYDPDVRLNTRTVVAPWWQRMLIAPNGVNYHMEHHFMASVPCYRLKALREHLTACHALDEVPRFAGYGAMLRHVVTPT